jgi:hypothetical protein
MEREGGATMFLLRFFNALRKLDSVIDGLESGDDRWGGSRG